jgi:hypothetical protein
MQHMCCHISVASDTPSYTQLITVLNYIKAHRKAILINQRERGPQTLVLNLRETC